jgi:hypothetical protein
MLKKPKKKELNGISVGFAAIALRTAQVLNKTAFISKNFLQSKKKIYKIFTFVY